MPDKGKNKRETGGNTKGATHSSKKGVAAGREREEREHRGFKA